MEDNKLLEAIEQMMDRKLEQMDQRLDQKLEPIKKDLGQVRADVTELKKDVVELKEEAKITRHSVNLLLNWAERADRTVVNAGLYTKDEE